MLSSVTYALQPGTVSASENTRCTIYISIHLAPFTCILTTTNYTWHMDSTTLYIHYTYTKHAHIHTQHHKLFRYYTHNCTRHTHQYTIYIYTSYTHTHCLIHTISSMILCSTEGLTGLSYECSEYNPHSLSFTTMAIDMYKVCIYKYNLQ